MYTIAALAAIGERERRRHGLFTFLMVGALFVVFIGLRYRVGGDWYSYLNYFKYSGKFVFPDVIASSDPGYALLNWLMYRWQWDIYGVNLICGIIFLVGLLVCCRQQTRPWLGFAVAFPYLVVVMAMGYTRQGVALGLFFLAIASMERGQFNRYLLFIAVAAFFHKTALVMIALGVFLHYKNWKLRAVAVLIAGYVLWDLLLAESQTDLWKNYVEAQMVSQGAKVRVAMNLVPGMLLLCFHKRWKELYPNYQFWMVLAVGSVASMVVVNFASTAVDRMALYLTPLQVVVFARLPSLLRGQLSPNVVTVGIIVGYALVLFVWLNYAIHAKYWLPYQNWLFL
ncbi:MAG: EpsG family protein [Desulfuromonas sp.]|nr:MAG: EpsG family protein [Desulfuromonas sp.]